MKFIKTYNPSPYDDSLEIEVYELEGKNNPGYDLIQVNALIIHGTANESPYADGLANATYWENMNGYGSTQFMVDAKRIAQFIDPYKVAYSVGAKRYTSIGNSLRCGGKSPNYSTINTEMCMNADGNYSIVEEGTIKLQAYLMWLTGKTKKDLLQHWHVTGKACHKYMYADKTAWEAFVNEIVDYYNKHYPGEDYGVDKRIIREVQITWDKLNVRKGPNTTFKVIGSFTKGQIVTVVSYLNGWYETDNNEWFYGSAAKDLGIKHPEPYQEFSTEEYYLSKGNISIYKENRGDSDVIGKIVSGHSFRILGVQEDWGKLEHGSWVNLEDVEMATRVPITLLVNTKVYSERNLNSPVVRYINEGEETILIIDKLADGWTRVSEGWMYEDKYKTT